MPVAMTPARIRLRLLRLSPRALARLRDDAAWLLDRPERGEAPSIVSPGERSTDGIRDPAEPQGES
jgi:hypothetical protein